MRRVRQKPPGGAVLSRKQREPRRRAPVPPAGARHSGRRRLVTILLCAGAILAAGGLAVFQFPRGREPVPVPERQPRHVEKPPNILFISVDMLRPDHLGCYGYGRPTSPRLDALAAEGVLFQNQISSSSWTLPAHAAMFTSLPDAVHGCTDTDRRLPSMLTSLPERFRTAGYRTAGFFSGPYLHPTFGFDRGFETYVDCTSYANTLDDKDVKDWAMDPAVMRESHRDVTNPIIFANVKEWLDDHAHERFFLFIHMWDPHFDFIPPPPYDTMFDPEYTGWVSGQDFFNDPRINKDMDPRDLAHLKALYDGEIAATDATIGRILDELRDAGVLDDTLVCVTSDHGTEFFEHGLKGHRKTLFDECIRVPLILRYPAGLPAGKRIAAQTRSIDIGPTMLELAGLGVPAGILGSSLLPLIEEGRPDFDNTAISELATAGRRMRTMRTPAWKFTDAMHSNLRFYMDLKNDPREQRILRDMATGQGLELSRRYAKWAAALARLREQLRVVPEQSDVPSDVMRVLKSVGYVGGDEDESD